MTSGEIANFDNFVIFSPKWWKSSFWSGPAADGDGISRIFEIFEKSVRNFSMPPKGDSRLRLGPRSGRKTSLGAFWGRFRVPRVSRDNVRTTYFKITKFYFLTFSKIPDWIFQNCPKFSKIAPHHILDILAERWCGRECCRAVPDRSNPFRTAREAFRHARLYRNNAETSY